ncbi:hypothetical protein ACN08X_07180 [Rothia sp. P6271]
MNEILLSHPSTDETIYVGQCEYWRNTAPVNLGEEDGLYLN